jgi:hypothetical protein
MVPVASSGAKATSSTRTTSLRGRVSMTRPTLLSAELGHRGATPGAQQRRLVPVAGLCALTDTLIADGDGLYHAGDFSMSSVRAARCCYAGAFVFGRTITDIRASLPGSATPRSKPSCGPTGAPRAAAAVVPPARHRAAARPAALRCGRIMQTGYSATPATARATCAPAANSCTAASRVRAWADDDSSSASATRSSPSLRPRR